MSLLSELKRRRVIKILIVYAGAAWVLIEAGSVLLPVFNAPVWLLRLLVMVAVLGFPVTFILSWVFDITPDGIRRTAPKSKRGLLTISGAVLLMIAGTAGIYFLVDPGRSEAARNTVAVLACNNWSGDPELDYFSDGLAEDIINRLSRLQSIRVIARQSSFTFKDESVSIPEVGKLLGVAHVLVCSVRQSDDGIRVNAQLVDTQTNLHIWSTMFNRGIEGVFDILDEIAVKIADSVLVELVGEDKAKLVRHDTESVEALEQYMKGRYYYNQVTLESLEESVAAFELALELDADFALAHVGLAESLVMQWQMQQGPWADTWLRIQGLLNTALELDGDLGEAYSMLGLHAAIPGSDWDKGRKLLHRALELRPNSHLVRSSYAQLLMFGGPRQDAIEHAQAARSLNPMESFMADLVIAAYYHTRDYERSLQEAEAVLMRHPDDWVAYWMMAWSFNCLDRNQEAIAALERALELSAPPGQILPGLACGYAMDGREDEANAIWEDLIATAENEYQQTLSTLDKKMCYEDTEATIEWLQLALDEKNPLLWMITHECGFDPFRGDPRFRAIVQKLGLDPDSID